MKAPWVTYRPELKVLDCTIRDGGLMNNHQFDDAMVKAVYEACVEAGIDYMEFGYKASKKVFARDEFGAWKYCDEDDVRRIVGDNQTDLKLSAMADAGKTDYKTDILPREQSVFDLIRVATYVNQIPEAVDMIKDAADKGYEVSANIMAVSAAQDAEIDEALDAIADTPASTVVVVDSFGSLYAEQIERLVKRYAHAMDGRGKDIGIHAHNNLQLGFANTIEAIIHGANRADCTIGGMGRGAGNCPTELLLGFLRNPKFKLRPIIKVLQDHVLPLRKQIEWGALVPYNITGRFNLHPRAAIKFLESDEKDDILAFYDRIVADT